MGIGLWLSAAVARQIVEKDLVDELMGRLTERGLVAFTFNGFPYGDFHGPRVKHQVYEPDWADPRRLRYTLDLIAIMSRVLDDRGPDEEGSISTLPIGWGRARQWGDEEKWQRAAGQLRRVVDELGRLEQETGQLIHVDLEPEPGCVLGASEDVVRLFEYLEQFIKPDLLRRYLRVCYDVCHAAVMFEEHRQAFGRYEEAGIRIGKVQISSAVKVDLAKLDDGRWAAALAQLAGFGEDRYLHQTVVREAGGGGLRFFEDLPEALSAYGAGHVGAGQMRVHFHVPVFLERCGLLETTQDQIMPCLRLMKQEGFPNVPPHARGELPGAGGSEVPRVMHFEVETYAWGVLPEALRYGDLTKGIAEELSWVVRTVGKASGAAGVREE